MKLSQGISEKRLGKGHETGMSLVEVMIAGAILTTVGLGVATLMSQSQKSAQSVQRKDDFTELQRIIQMGGNAANCTAMFGGSAALSAWPVITAATTVQPPSLVLPLNGGTISDIGAANRTYGSGIYITGISVDFTGNNLGGNTYGGWLNITAERHNPNRPAARLPGPPLSARIPLSLIDGNGDGRADSCTVGTTVEESPRTELVVATSGPADCPGSNTSAIQDCLNRAAATNPARSVLVRAGNYDVQGLNMPVGVTLRGEPGTVFRTTATTTMIMLSTANTGTSTAMTVIKDITFDQNTGATAAIGIVSESARSLQNILIQNNRFLNTSVAPGVVTGVVVSATGGSSITGLTISDNIFGDRNSLAYASNHPMYFMLAGGSFIRDLTIDNNMLRSVDLSSITEVALDFLVVDTSSLNRIKIRNNRINAADGGSVRFNFTPATAGSSLSEVVIEKNYLAGYGDEGVLEFDGTPNVPFYFVKIEDNVIWRNGGGQGGINFDAWQMPQSCQRESIIRGNYVYAPSKVNGTGIDLDTCFGRVEGNEIQGYDQGISLTHAWQNHEYISEIRNNRIVSGSNGIYTTIRSIISGNVITDALTGIRTTATDMQINDNTITTETAGSAACGTAATRVFGICAPGDRSEIHRNRVQVLTGTGHGIHLTGGTPELTANTSLNRIVDAAGSTLANTRRCVNCVPAWSACRQVSGTDTAVAGDTTMDVTLDCGVGWQNVSAMADCAGGTLARAYSDPAAGWTANGRYAALNCVRTSGSYAGGVVMYAYGWCCRE